MFPHGSIQLSLSNKPEFKLGTLPFLQMYVDLHPTVFSHRSAKPLWALGPSFHLFCEPVGFYLSIRCAICKAITLHMMVQWILKGQGSGTISYN